MDNIPEHFCLGKGHVKFFYNKINFLHNRYYKLHSECIRRGFKVENYSDAFRECEFKHSKLCNNWEPTSEAIIISLRRIHSKINEKPNFYRWTKYEA